MRKKFKNIGILACLAILFLFVSDAFTAWRYNPFTRKLDYYSIDIGAGLGAEAAGDILYHDGTNWTNLTAGANGLVLTLNAGLPTWIAAGGGAPVAGEYLTLALNGALTQERVLTAGSGIAFADTGANGTLTISSIPNMTNIFYVSAGGGDYATITSALAAENAGGEVFLIGPGTYANDQIDFSANGQTVIGMGHTDDVHVTQADTTVIPFGAFTDCVVRNVHVEVTAPSTAAADVITGTGSLYLYDVHVELTNTNVVVADQPACIDTTGIVQMFGGIIEYANTGNDGGGATAIKAAVRIGPGAAVWLNRAEFTVTGGNLSLALTSLYATGGAAAFYRCYIDVDDDASSNTVGIIYSDMAAGGHEMFGNDIHVDNDTNIAHGVFLINVDTTRSMYNHIHVTGGTAYGLNAEAGTTITSQFDDITATDGPTTGAGAFTVLHSGADGDLTVTGTVTTANIAGAAIGSDVQAWDADLDTYAGITPSANVQTLLSNATFALFLADLSGTAGAAFAWNGQNITGLNSIYLVEQAEADADIGGSGQIWVDADNPNTLWFTDEDGTDVQLGAASTFKLKVDAGATEDYFGVAGGDGLFRFTANEFTMADGGNFVTLSLADHATARTALGLQIGTDVQAQNAVLTELTALTDPAADEFPFWNDTTNNFEFSTVLFPTATGVTIGAAGNAGKLELEDADGDVLAIQVGVQAGNTTYTWPTAFGTTGWVLASTDAGTMSWVAAPAHAMADHTDDDTYNISTSGSSGTGEITVADGGGINLQEDITWTGATGVNLGKFPDNLAEALVFEEGGTSYQTFVSTDNVEEIQMNVGVQFDTIAYFDAEYDEGAEGGAFTIVWANGQKQKVTITGVALDMSFTDPPGPCNLMLTIIQGDGDDTIDWTHDTKIGGAGGTAPTLSTGAADTDVIGIYFDGTNYWISVMLDTDLFT